MKGVKKEVSYLGQRQLKTTNNYLITWQKKRVAVYVLTRIKIIEGKKKGGGK